MSRMVKRERELLALVKNAGLEVADAGINGAGKYTLLCKAEDGAVHEFTFPRTPSDNARGDKNAAADLRRFAAAHRLTAVGAAILKVKPDEYKHVAKVAAPPLRVTNIAFPVPTETKEVIMTVLQTEGVKAKKTRATPKTVNRLKAPQFYKLCEYLKGIDLPNLLLTQEQIAKNATEAIGFAVSKQSVVTAAEAIGVKFARHYHSAGGKSKRSDEHMLALATTLISLLRDLGREVPLEVLQIVEPDLLK